MNTVAHHKASKEQGVILTDQASRHLLSYLDQHGDCHGVRFSVKKTGCSGLSYVVDYVANPEEGDVVLPLSQCYSICIDQKSYPFLKGMRIDYVKQGINGKLVFDNPNQTGQCGCGESFTVG